MTFATTDLRTGERVERRTTDLRTGRTYPATKAGALSARAADRRIGRGIERAGDRLRGVGFAGGSLMES